MKVSSIGSSALISAVSGSRRCGGIRSTLLSASQTRRRALGEPVEDGPHRVGQPGAAVHDQQGQVGVLRPAPGGGDHGAVEPPARREDAGRVHQHDLRRAPHHHGADAEARGLRLGRDDRHLGAGERVDERGLAGVRRAHHGDQAAARFRRSRPAPPVPSPLRSPPFHLREPRLGRRLLRRPPRVAHALRLPPRRDHRHREDRLVRRPGGGDRAVLRQVEAAPLQPFLQPALGRRARPARRLPAAARRRGAGRAAPRPARRRGRARRAALPARRPGRCAARSAPPCSRPAAPPAPRRGRALPPRRPGCPRRPARRSGAPASPSRSSGKRSISHSAISRPSTRSPMNSSRSLESSWPRRGIGGGAVGQRLAQQFRPGEAVADARLRARRDRAAAAALPRPAVSSPSRRRSAHPVEDAAPADGEGPGPDLPPRRRSRPRRRR